MNAIFSRTSVRKFLNKEIPHEILEKILKAGMQAPSAHNFCPWEFLVVQNPQDKEAISKMSPYATPAKDAAVNIIALANMNTVLKEDLWWQQDMAACTQNMLIQVEFEGLGGVWLGFYPEQVRMKKLSDYFNLSENIIPFSVIAIGYPSADNSMKDKCDWTKVKYNSYL